MQQVGLLVLGLAVVVVPNLASAAVVVAEPTGDVDPAFLAEMKASLETVAAEAPAELNAELRSSATVTVAGVELVVEYVPFIGAEPIRETRVASKASASAQARAMGRAALEALKGTASAATEPTAPTPVPAVTVPQPEEVIRPPEPEPEPEPEPPPPPPPPPPLPEKYNRHKAMRLSLLSTAIVAGTGAAFAGLSVRVPAMLIPAVATASLGLVLGPSVGYFWIGETPHALVFSGLRLVTGGLGITFMTLFFTNLRMGDDCTSENGTTVCEIEEEFHPGYLIGGILGIAATIAAAFVDAGLVGRAADRVNEQWRRDLSATAA